jgi:hypothetical protein
MEVSGVGTKGWLAVHHDDHCPGDPGRRTLADVHARRHHREGHGRDLG